MRYAQELQDAQYAQELQARLARSHEVQDSQHAQDVQSRNVRNAPDAQDVRELDMEVSEVRDVNDIDSDQEDEAVANFDERADNEEVRRQLDWMADSLSSSLNDATSIGTTEQSRHSFLLAAVNDVEFVSRVEQSAGKIRYSMNLRRRRMEREMARGRRLLSTLDNVRCIKTDLVRNKYELDACNGELRRLVNERRVLMDRRSEMCVEANRAIEELRRLRDRIPVGTASASAPRTSANTSTSTSTSTNTNSSNTNTSTNVNSARQPVVVLDRLRIDSLTRTAGGTTVTTSPIGSGGSAAVTAAANAVTTRSVGTDPEREEPAAASCSPRCSDNVPTAEDIDPLAQLAARVTYCNICTAEMPMSSFLMNFSCSHVHCRECVRHHYEVHNDISWTRKLRLRDLQCMTCRTPISQYFMLQRAGELYSYKPINYNIDLLESPPVPRS